MQRYAARSARLDTRRARESLKWQGMSQRNSIRRWYPGAFACTLRLRRTSALVADEMPVADAASV